MRIKFEPQLTRIPELKKGCLVEFQQVWNREWGTVLYLGSSRMFMTDIHKKQNTHTTSQDSALSARSLNTKIVMHGFLVGSQTVYFSSSALSQQKPIIYENPAPAPDPEEE